jgi:hypothetical protein
MSIFLTASHKRLLFRDDPGVAGDSLKMVNSIDHLRRNYEKG